MCVAKHFVRVGDQENGAAVNVSFLCPFCCFCFVLFGWLVFVFCLFFLVAVASKSL